MSKRKLPDYRLKQKILYIDKTSPDALVQYGNSYLEQEAYADALEFYIKAGHQAGIDKIKNLAMEKGDVFLFQGATKALKAEISKSEWENIARRAMDQKKYSFARHALEKAGNVELLSVLANKMKAEAQENHA